jgi:hypothetical protein
VDPNPLFLPLDPELFYSWIREKLSFWLPGIKLAPERSKKKGTGSYNFLSLFLCRIRNKENSMVQDPE